MHLAFVSRRSPVGDPIAIYTINDDRVLGWEGSGDQYGWTLVSDRSLVSMLEKLEKMEELTDRPLPIGIAATLVSMRRDLPEKAAQQEEDRRQQQLGRAYAQWTVTYLYPR
jgi:hypothetical protein